MSDMFAAFTSYKYLRTAKVISCVEAVVACVSSDMVRSAGINLHNRAELCIQENCGHFQQIL
jgi:hypothetical protein